jgi:hypothetical protein
MLRVMLLRISEKFRRHYRLKPTSCESPVRPFPLTWNVDVLPWGQQQLIVLASEEYTLFSFLLGLSRGRSIERFQEAFRSRLKGLLDNIGWWQLPFLPMFTFSKRANRSIIGSQNELLFLTCAHLEGAGKPAGEDKLRQIEESINRCPMSYLEMESPVRALQTMCTQARR